MQKEGPLQETEGMGKSSMFDEWEKANVTSVEWVLENTGYDKV